MYVRRFRVCVAFALVCVLICASSVWGVYYKELIGQNDLSLGASNGLVLSGDGTGLSLAQSLNYTPFVWAPSPTSNAVSKIDARTGTEIARYRIGPASEEWQPCAVAADEAGNAYVACAAPNGTGCVVMIMAKGGFDYNRDGMTSTSGDFDSNKTITPTEILPWGADEKVGLVGTVGSAGSNPSAIIYDGLGNLWVSLYQDCKICKIDISTGKTVAVVPVVGKPGNMLLGNGDTLWVLSRDNRSLTEVDTKMNIIRKYQNIENADPSGMCMDSDGKLWIGNARGGLLKFDPTDSQWSSYGENSGLDVASIAIDGSGDIWAACPAAGAVARFSSKDGKLGNEVQIAMSASSISTDSDGYIWVLCERNNIAIRIDPGSEKPVASTETCIAPFSSTPFGSRVTDKGYMPNGTWRSVFDSQIQGAGWGSINWTALEIGGFIRVEARTGDTPEGLYSAKFQPVMNGKRYSAPNGRYIEIRVTVQGNGHATPVLQAMSIEGTNLPPDVSKAKPTSERIGRLDHVMQSVSIMDVKDPEGDPFKIVVTKVTQDEPVFGLDKGDKCPDAMLTNGPSVWLRGECDFGTAENPGNGRVYTVAFTATDQYGASSTGKVKVTITPSIKPSEVAIQDKDSYDSTKDILKSLAKAE